MYHMIRGINYSLLDTTDLLRNFRDAALRRGIDPNAGATSFQAAMLKAELVSQSRTPHSITYSHFKEIGRSNSRPTEAAAFAQMRNALIPRYTLWRPVSVYVPTVPLPKPIQFPRPLPV